MSTFVFAKNWLTRLGIPLIAMAFSGFLHAQSLSAPGASVPTLVQHVATGMDRWPATTLTINLPNPAGRGNALILGVQFNSAGSISSVVDNKGNTWVAGPTAISTAYSQRMNLYYCLNAIAGTQNITVTFSGLGATNARPQAVVSEFYNVAPAAAFDGSSSSPTSLAPGAITTRASGDLIYQWGVDFSDTNAYGGAFNGTRISPGANFTLLSADLQVGSSDQYYIQPNAGVISPSFTTSGSATWGSVALALKPATAGTPPSPGIRIVHVQHTLLTGSRAQGRTTPIVMQFPSTGNLLVGLYNSADVSVSSIIDNVLNNWVSAGLTLGGGLNDVAQILYAANAITGPNLDGIAVTLTGISTGDVMFVLYDVAGADASPFDKATTAFGIQLGGKNLTTASLAPSTPNELVFNETSIDFHTINGLIGTGFTLDSVVNAYDNDDPPNGGTDTSTLDEDNGYAHVYAPTTSLLTFTYTYTAHLTEECKLGVVRALRLSRPKPRQRRRRPRRQFRRRRQLRPQHQHQPPTPTPTPTPTPVIAFVQGSSATPQTPEASVLVALSKSQTAGNLNVVIVGCNDTTKAVSSITDSLGNSYALAVGPTKGTGITQSIYYAANIKAGSNTVKVTFSGSASFPDVRVLEYSGLRTLDNGTGASGSSGNSSVSIITHSMPELVVAGNTVANLTTGPGSGFTRRLLTQDGDIAEDATESSAGTFTASAVVNGGSWVMQAAAFGNASPR